MAVRSFTGRKRIRKNFGRRPTVVPMPNLIEVQKNSFDEALRQLVETRIKMTRQKLDNQNLQKLLKKRIKVTRSILNLNNTTQ